MELRYWYNNSTTKEELKDTTDLNKLIRDLKIDISNDLPEGIKEIPDKSCICTLTDTAPNVLIKVFGTLALNAIKADMKFSVEVI